MKRKKKSEKKSFNEHSKGGKIKKYKYYSTNVLNKIMQNFVPLDSRNILANFSV